MWWVRETEICVVSERNRDMCGGGEKQRYVWWVRETEKCVVGERNRDMCGGGEKESETDKVSI